MLIFNAFSTALNSLKSKLSTLVNKSFLSKVAICSSIITDSFFSPSFFIFTWVGILALFVWDVILATITVEAYLFPMSFCNINTGLVPPWTELFTCGLGNFP